MVVFLCNVLPQLPRAGELLVALFASVSVPRAQQRARGGVAQVLVGVGRVERELGEKKIENYHFCQDFKSEN